MEFNMFLRIIMVIFSLSWMPYIIKPWEETTLTKMGVVIWTIIFAMLSFLATIAVSIVVYICFNFIRYGVL